MSDIDDLLAGSDPSPVEVKDEPIVSSTPPATNKDTSTRESVPSTASNNQSDSADSPSTTGPVDTILDALMARISSVDEGTDYWKGLIYGPPGVGKSVFVAGAPGTLFVDVEKGKRSLKNHPELANVKVLDFKSIYQLELLIKKIAEGALPWVEHLVIDSFTEIQKRDLDDVLKARAGNDPAAKYIPTGPDYNANTEHMRQIASDLRNLDCHVTVTCHVKEEKEDSTGRLLVRPNLTAKLAGTMNHLFGTVGYMTLDGDVRTLQVHPSDKVTAKTRIGGLPSHLENPNIADLIYLNSATNKDN